MYLSSTFEVVLSVILLTATEPDKETLDEAAMATARFRMFELLIPSISNDELSGLLAESIVAKL